MRQVLHRPGKLIDAYSYFDAQRYIAVVTIVWLCVYLMVVESLAANGGWESQCCVVGRAKLYPHTRTYHVLPKNLKSLSAYY